MEGRCNTVAHGQRVDETVRLDEPNECKLQIMPHDDQGPGGGRGECIFPQFYMHSRALSQSFLIRYILPG
jgi:hypothetical protein